MNPGEPSGLPTDADLMASILTPFTSKRVLIVEEEIDIATEIRNILEADGYECRILLSPLRLLEVIQSFRPHLLTTGIRMSGMNGLNVIQLIKTEWRVNLPIIVISDCRKKFFINEAYALGVDDYIFRPFDPEDVLDRIQWLLENNGAERI